ncbi:MAG: rhodanese-like domain-containing protein [Myxococcaceae bacterium]
MAVRTKERVAYGALGALALLVMFLAMGRNSAAGSASEAQALVKKGAVLLDVRTPDEFRMRHLEGALNIPVDELRGRMAELPPKGTQLVVYCHSGARSRAASRLLEGAGYPVYDLGAMDNW